MLENYSVPTAASGNVRGPELPLQFSRMLTFDDLSAIVQKSVDALRLDVKRGKGPRVTKFGKLIRFQPRDVEAWIAQQVIETPAKPTKLAEQKTG